MSVSESELQEAYGRLVVVTNREPFRVVEREGKPTVERALGGLIAALEPAMRRSRGLWVSADENGIQDDAQAQAELEKLSYDWVPVPCPSSQYDGYYLGFSNQALWPLYHGMLGLTTYSRDRWSDFSFVNRRFAETTNKSLRSGDLVWIHDYQLSLLPAMVREGGLPDGVQLGFYLHIPFPSYDVFRTLPWAKDILRGMLGAGLVGFHVAEYCENFFNCVEEILGVRCDRLRGRIRYEGRWVHVRALPIGIDAAAFRKASETPEVQARAEALRNDLSAETLIVGVDRLDYTKGIVERLQALETFFERHPDRRGKVSFVQLAVPSRSRINEYQQLREEIEQLVGHINGLYAKLGWTPITYLFRSLAFEELVALYLAADVALITPLRDGMNLVAKEYVASHHHRVGSLILSELTGAAQQLTEASLVNPYDVDAIAEAIDESLREPPETKRRRMAAMGSKVSRQDVGSWVDAFLTEMLYAE